LDQGVSFQQQLLVPLLSFLEHQLYVNIHSLLQFVSLGSQCLQLFNHFLRVHLVKPVFAFLFVLKVGVSMFQLFKAFNGDLTSVLKRLHVMFNCLYLGSQFFYLILLFCRQILKVRNFLSFFCIGLLLVF
jgi:hypothetical protein